MSKKRPIGRSGRLVVIEHTSRVLAGNPLGDPVTRTVSVWLPPHYDQPRSRNRRFPVIYDLVGYTGSGASHTNWRPFDENVPDRCARLIHERKMGPVIVVFPDCFTALGGNQYINSSAIGPYADYLIKEIVPMVDGEFRTLASRDHRACFGKSSGGYGAMIHGMRYARTWGAIANHSGDALFDIVYRSDLPNTLNELGKHRKKPRKPGTTNVVSESKLTGEGLDDGRIRRFLEHIWRTDKLTNAEVHCLMNVCMAATYDPDPDAPNGFRFPLDLETGELITSRWRRWLRHDPALLVRRYRKNLKSLKGIYIDCGWKDQYHIHYGSRVISKRLREEGIGHTYEEFDDNHSSVDYRMDRSLPFLCRSVS